VALAGVRWQANSMMHVLDERAVLPNMAGRVATDYAIRMQGGGTTPSNTD
jgi:hypothetical protein